MMPAASNKTEQKTSPEAGEVSKTYLNILDRKVRNIEKRKSRLDSIKQKAAAGDTLEKEQQETLQNYEIVLATLDFTRDLQKTFTSTSQDIEKQVKKQVKREKQERAASDLKRTVEILQIQTTLDALGNDSVRQHFKTGKHGAVVLTEDNLNSLDELYKLISPPVAGEEKFADKLGVASEHLNSLVEGKERAVTGSTYKELMDLLNLIINCGYFERAREAEKEEEDGGEAEAAEESKEVEEEAEEEPSPAEAAPSTEAFIEPPPAEVLPPAAPVSTPAPDMEEPSLSHSQVLAPTVSPHEPPAASFVAQMPLSASPTLFQAPPPMEAPPTQPPAPKSRPLAEIVSQVEGTFSFLQESEIDLDSPHMDPAVVAAQPMMRPPSVPSQQPPQTAMMGVGFAGASPLVDQSGDGEVADALSQQSLPQSAVDFGAGQGFVSHAAASLSSGVVADAMFQPPVEDAPAPPSAQQQQPQQPPHAAPHSMMGQTLTSPGESVAQYELPPSIPLPPSQQNQQDAGQLGSQEKKFQLNASATEFQSRSMYSHQMPLNMHPQHPGAQPPHPPNTHPDARPMPPPSNVNQDFSAPNFAQAAADFSHGNYQGGSYQQRGGRGGAGGPGYRGGPRGGRGGNNNNGNVAMPNGFNGRPQNGNSRPGNRGGQGGTAFQGFPPRTDYRPDSFQGYNSNGFAGAPYQKRGGAGGPGYPRGGNNRGAGGMRGGVSRGGPPRGAGGNRGGMNRPGNQ